MEEKAMEEKAMEEKAMEEKALETRWLYVTSENFPKLVEVSKKTCVIPIGCVEMHGFHLPLGTDIIAASSVSYAASQLEPVAVFPDFTFGDVPGYRPKHPGHIALPVEMEMMFLEHFCDQIALNGFERILLVNGHGGNSPWLGAFLRNLDNRDKSYVCARCSVPAFCPHGMAEYLQEHGPGSIPELTEEDEAVILKCHEDKMIVGHAGMSETSLVMAATPESVHLDRIGVLNGHSLRKTDSLCQAGVLIRDWGWDINYPNAYEGDDPVGLNDRIAKAAFRMSTERLADMIRLFKNDENVMGWHEEYLRGWR